MMFGFKLTLLSLASIIVAQQHGPTTTPVPILKQINQQNDDGSYSFGYEAADGSFKIETKYPSGDVAGKYGYVDADGKLREISYGASSKRGFEPQGAGIVVPPVTVGGDHPASTLAAGQEDDGQYREDPKIYEDPKYNTRSQKTSGAQGFRTLPKPAQFQVESYQPTTAAPFVQRQQYQPQPQYQQPQYQQQQYQPQQQSTFSSGPLFSQQTNLFDQSPQQFPQPQFSQRFSQQYRPQSQVYHQQPQFSYQAYTPQTYQPQSPSPAQYQQTGYQPNLKFNPFAGHPAQNFDPSTGSYTINFTGK